MPTTLRLGHLFMMTVTSIHYTECIGQTTESANDDSMTIIERMT